jgi:hypothetical protein
VVFAFPDTIKRLARNHTVRAIVGVLLVAAVVVAGMLTIYYVGPNGLPTVHQHRVFKQETAVTRTSS